MTDQYHYSCNSVALIVPPGLQKADAFAARPMTLMRHDKETGVARQLLSGVLILTFPMHQEAIAVKDTTSPRATHKGKG